MKEISKMSSPITNPFQSQTNCPGIEESSIIPILLSSLSTTELCLMFFIERDRNDQKIIYRSRNCDKVVHNGKYCNSCQDLFDNLCHFHHLHLKKSCKQFRNENSDQISKLDEAKRSLGNVALTIETVEGENKEQQVNSDQAIKLDKAKSSLGNVALTIETVEVENKEEQQVNSDQAIKLDKAKRNLGNVALTTETVEVENKEEQQVNSDQAIKLDKAKRSPGNVALTIETVEGENNKEEQMVVVNSGEETLFNMCDECGEIFDNRNLLQKHLVMKHTTDSTKEVLNKEFEFVFQYQQYQDNREVDVDNDIKLEDTHGNLENQQIPIMESYQVETGVKQERKKYLCKYCELAFDKESQKYRHYRMNHSDKIEETKRRREDKNSKCPFCLDNVSRHQIYKHLLEMHFKEKDDPIYQEIMSRRYDNKLVCSECGQDFEVRQAYHSHLYREHKEVFGKDYLCNICGEGFISKYALKNHNEKVHENDPFYCVECNKTFLTKQSFSTHVKSVHTPVIRECQECGKKLKAKAMLRHMQLVHIKNKKHRCSECPKAFVIKTQLLKHIEQVHQSLRPYGCEQCTYRASSMFNLNLHRKKMHQATDSFNKQNLIELIENGQHPFCGNDFIILMNQSVV